MSQAEKVVALLDDAAQRERTTVVQVSETAAILSVIERAAQNPAVDIDKMQRLFEMRDAALDRTAREAFAAAMAEMQPHLPVIAERGKIDLGKGRPQSYALWEDINEAVKPVLAQFGFALTFKTGREGDRIIVTGILSHREGHREETTMHLPVDASGSKNAVQAIGSSTSYGKRYTASALLNLTSRLKEDRDDDGRASAELATISDDQAVELRELAEAVGADVPRFCRFFKIASITALPAAQFGEALDALKRKGAAR